MKFSGVIRLKKFNGHKKDGWRLLMMSGSLVKWARTGTEPVLIILLEEQIKNVLWTALFLPQGRICHVIESECEVINESR